MFVFLPKNNTFLVKLCYLTTLKEHLYKQKINIIFFNKIQIESKEFEFKLFIKS